MSPLTSQGMYPEGGKTLPWLYAWHLLDKEKVLWSELSALVRDGGPDRELVAEEMVSRAGMPGGCREHVRKPKSGVAFPGAQRLGVKSSRPWESLRQRELSPPILPKREWG